jgi:hypothetical protein
MNTNGNSNVAIGPAALRYNGTGTENTAVGGSALLFSSRGGNSVALGCAASLNLGGSNNPRKRGLSIRVPEMPSAFHPRAHKTFSVAPMRVANNDYLPYERISRPSKN